MNLYRKNFSNSTIKAGWRQIGEHLKYYRSAWEANYARYLQWQEEHGHIKQWFHEPRTFWFADIKRGTNNYKPDFMVDYGEGRTAWFEVKGYMDAKSKTKIARFKKYYPEETLNVIDGKWFRNNNPKMKLLIKGWEMGNAPKVRKKQETNPQKC
jgi:hypothetical protein